MENPQPASPIREFTESHYFRLPSALPARPVESHDQVTFFKYSTTATHADNGNIDADGEKQTTCSFDGYAGLLPAEFPIPPSSGWTGDSITIAYFGTCDETRANDFIKKIQGQATVTERNIIPTLISDPVSTVPSPPSLRNIEGFVTGLSILADFPDDNKKALTLLLALPYIGLRDLTPAPDGTPAQKGRGKQSLSLPQYAHLGVKAKPNTGNEAPKIMVHQAWFALFDDSRLAVFKSCDDPQASAHAPLHSFQPRINAFLALPSLVSNLLRPSERAPLKILRTKIKNLLCTLAAADTTLKNKRLTKEELEISLHDLSAMIGVICEQIEILGDLRELCEGQMALGNGGCEWGGCVRLPFMTYGGETSGNLGMVTEKLVKERIAFRGELERWLDEIRAKIVGSEDVGNKSLKAMLAQGQTISVFTLITTVFMPLGFVTTYYNPASFENSVKSTSVFWRYAGAITASIFVVMVVFLYLPDDRIKDWIKRQFQPLIGYYKGNRKHEEPLKAHNHIY